MAIRKFGEVEGLDEWSRRMNQIMDEMRNREYVEFRDARTWQPATNVYETPTTYHICVELSGMRLDDIEITCRDDRRVMLRGQRPMPRPAGIPELCVHVLEVDEGPFEREIDLPEPFDVDAVRAEYENGFLWITLPKKKRA